MNALQTFEFNTNQLRIETDEHGNPWFCAKDVCAILGYANPNDIVKKLCRSDGVSNRYPIQDNLGRTQYPTFINEGNLYRLIIKSNKPESEPFESWVCDEVLPAIRKTGSYLTAVQGPLTLEQFHDRQKAIKAAQQDLRGATVMLTGAELMELKITPEFLQALRSPKEAKQKISDLIIQMAKDGHTREEIAARLGRSRNNVRQVLFHARKQGLLSGQDGAE